MCATNGAQEGGAAACAAQTQQQTEATGATRQRRRGAWQQGPGMRAAAVLLTGVEGIQALAGGAAVDAVALNQAHEGQLGQQHSHDGLGVDQGGVAQVVEAALLEDLRASLEPHSLAEAGDAVVLQQLGGHAAQGACRRGGRRGRRTQGSAVGSQAEQGCGHQRRRAGRCQGAVLLLPRVHACMCLAATHRAWPSGHG